MTQYQLKKWEEAVGRLKAVRDHGNGTITLVFVVNMRMEVTIPGEVGLFNKLVGCQVGLLRTDDPMKYIVRVIKSRGR